MAFQFNQGDRPLSGYTIERGVGRGGFGEVYYAKSDGGKEVALKYLRENPQVELRGVAHCLNLKSPYLVDLHDVKQNADGDFFVIMEYVSGPSLRDLMNNEPDGLGPQKAAYFLREIGKGLAYLHDRGIVHRDLKPGNIFYEDGYVKIGDYGLAKIMAASQHSGQTVSVGTVHYMAPEVGSGNYDRTIDIYAMGVMLYEMLLGRVPYSGATMGEVLMKHLTAQPEVDELPEPFPHVIRKALAKDPKDRYQSIGEMMSAVFGVENIERSVASLDSLSLTRMAAAVSKKVRQGVAVGAGGAMRDGSSNVPPLGETQAAQPPVIDRARGGKPYAADGARRLPHAMPAAEHRMRDSSGQRLRGFVKDGWFPEKSRLTTGLLGVVLGPVGAHRFYTGYAGVGVLQIILTCTTGFGGLWGFIEGIRILAGFDFRDSLGRPLLERGLQPGSRRGTGEAVDDVVREIGDGIGRLAKDVREKARKVDRWAVSRTIWGIVAVLGLLAVCGFLLGGMFAPAEMEEMSTGLSPDYYVNVFHCFYGLAAACLALGVFSVWKAAHRAGLSAWRATLRPALLCCLFTIMTAGFVWARFFSVGQFQLAGFIVMGVAALAFLFVWLLRGPKIAIGPSDHYWNVAWARIFVVLSIAAIVGMAAAGRSWNRAGRVFETSDEAVFSSVSVWDHQWVYDPEIKDNRYRRIRVDKRGPAPSYNAMPVALGLLGVLFVGSISEAQYRRKSAALALTTTSESTV